MNMIFFEKFKSLNYVVAYTFFEGSYDSERCSCGSVFLSQGIFKILPKVCRFLKQKEVSCGNLCAPQSKYYAFGIW
jgi:hypothetical protein